MYNLVEDEQAAEYILKSNVSNCNTPEAPVIVFRLGLYDKAGNQAGSWSDTVRRVINDDGSWW